MAFQPSGTLRVIAPRRVFFLRHRRCGYFIQLKHLKCSPGNFYAFQDGVVLGVSTQLHSSYSSIMGCCPDNRESSSYKHRSFHQQAAINTLDTLPSDKNTKKGLREAREHPSDKAIPVETSNAISRAKILKKPIPANFVSETFLPHLEHQIIHMAPSFSVMQLGEVGGAYARLPEALREKEVEKVLLSHFRKAMKNVHTPEEVIAVVSLMELLWAGVPEIDQEGDKKVGGVLGWFGLGSAGKSGVEADLFVSLHQKIESQPSLLSGLSVLNMFSIIRAYVKALSFPSAFQQKDRDDLESFVRMLREKADQLLHMHDPQELLSIVASIATYGQASLPPPPPPPQQQQQHQHQQQQQQKQQQSHVLASESLSLLLSRNPHLAVLPHVLRQIDVHVKQDNLSFFQLFQLLHLLQKCGIRHQGVLEECVYFLHNGTYAPKQQQQQQQQQQRKQQQQQEGQQKQQQQQQDDPLTVDAEALSKMSVLETSQFIQALGQRIRSQGLVQQQHEQQQQQQGAAPKAKGPVADVLPPSLLVKIAWCFNQFGEFARVERVLERPILRAASKFGPVDFARLSQTLPHGAPVLHLICNRLAATAARLQPFEFLFFVVGSLHLGRLYTPDLADSAEAATRDIQVRDSYVNLRPLVQQYFANKKEELSPSQINSLLLAIRSAAPTREHAQNVLQLLPKEWVEQQQLQRKKQSVRSDDSH